MENFIGIRQENEERDRLPISPIAFGSGAKRVVPSDSHLLLSVRQGSIKLNSDGTEDDL